MSDEGWTEYTGQGFARDAIVEVRWPDSREVTVALVFPGHAVRGASDVFLASRGRMEFRELVPLAEAEKAIRDAFDEGYDGALSGEYDEVPTFVDADAFLTAWRERRSK